MLRSISLVLVALIFAAGSRSHLQQGAQASSHLLWQNSFETESWGKAWNVTEYNWGGKLRARRTDDDLRLGEGTKAGPKLETGSDPLEMILRVRYPAGSVSPNAHRKYGTPLGGTQFYAKPLSPYDQLHLRYYVRFAPGFQFNKGGKLPGLFGGTCCSGGCQPDGTNGFSTRYMWRTQGDGEVYAYLDMTSKTGFGISLGRGLWSFESDPRSESTRTGGKWFCLEQECRLNDPAKSDGSITVWLDGVEVMKATGLKFRTISTLQIEGIMFSTFYGGDDPTWAAPKDEKIDFKKFALSDKYIGF